MSESFAPTPEPPYWVVVFTSRRSAADPDGYARMAEAMEKLAAEQPGYLGFESVRDASGLGVTLSYWRTEADLAAWKRVAAHLAAQRAGHERWYDDFRVRVARVERAYGRADSPREGL